MKKILTTTLFIAIVAFASVGYTYVASVFENIDYSLKIGDRTVELSNPMFENEDRVYVSIRNLCDELKIPISWDEEKQEIKLDIYNKQVNTSKKTDVKEDGVIPDEETALAVGKIILEKYSGKKLEYETEDKVYYLEAIFDETNNIWTIRQWYDYKNGGGWTASGPDMYLPTVKLNKNTGEVIYVNTYSFIENLKD